MTMNGIDISHWQSSLDASKVTAEFIIIKATNNGDSNAEATTAGGAEAATGTGNSTEKADTTETEATTE